MSGILPQGRVPTFLGGSLGSGRLSRTQARRKRRARRCAADPGPRICNAARRAELGAGNATAVRGPMIPGT